MTEINFTSAEQLVDYRCPELKAFIVRSDLARMFAVAEGRSINVGLRHFANHFHKEATHKELRGMLVKMASSQSPESFISVVTSIREKAIKAVMKELGMAR